MDNKFKLIEEIVLDKNNHCLIAIKKRIKQTDDKLVSKELSFGLVDFLDDFFNNHFNSRNDRKIDFNKIKIFGNDFLYNIFSKISSKKTDIEYFDVISLCEKSNYILTEHEPLHDSDNVYGDLKNDVLYAIKMKNELFDKDIQPRYKSTMNIYNFGTYTIHSVSTGYCNLPFITGVSWFSNELKDYRVKLNYSTFAHKT